LLYKGAMNPTRIAAALLAAQLFAGVTLAQSVPSSSEFARASGGEISGLTKAATNKLSGSLGFMTGGGRRGYSATFGGPVVKDRLWFFASAEQQELRLSSSAIEQMQLPQQPQVQALPASFLSLRSTAAVSDSTFFKVSFDSQR
jgi:hypothetical protein